jgi:hypothetical protein
MVIVVPPDGAAGFLRFVPAMRTNAIISESKPVAMFRWDDMASCSPLDAIAKSMQPGQHGLTCL